MASLGEWSFIKRATLLEIDHGVTEDMEISLRRQGISVLLSTPFHKYGDAFLDCRRESKALCRRLAFVARVIRPGPQFRCGFANSLRYLWNRVLGCKSLVSWNSAWRISWRSWRLMLIRK